MTKIQITVLIVILVGVSLWSENTHSDGVNTLRELRETVTNIHQETQNAAIGIAVVEQGHVVWVDGLGTADIAHERKATADSIFPVGSISKTFVSLAVLRLVNEGKLELQAPLKELAPEITHHNPWDDSNPVRLVHLLEHTTGWPDMSFAEYAQNGSEYSGLAQALDAYPERRRSRWVPGTRMAYSNIGPAVAAYIVQQVSGMPFERYVKQQVLSPLGMSSTGLTAPQNGQGAYPYIDQKRSDFKRPLYPPSGPLYSSPKDMAKLLRFFLGWGKGDEHHEPLLPTRFVQRMETPKTTLGNAQGVTAGYGLGNRSSGFQRFGIDFHGHRGGIPGAIAIFEYAPDLNSGYFLALTGSPAGAQALTDAVKTYLLRDQSPYSLNNVPPLRDARALTGTYKPLNQPVDFMSFVPTFFRAMTLSITNNVLLSTPLASGHERRYIEGDASYIDVSSGLPSLAQVTDPIAGGTVQIGSTLYQKIAKHWVWAELGYWVLVIIASALSVIAMVIYLPVRLYRNTLFQHATTVSLWPSLASVSFMIGVLYPLINPLNITQVTPWSGPTTVLFGTTLAYAGFATLGVLSLPTIRKVSFGKTKKTAITTITLLHASMALYLSSHGVIGMRLWTW